MNGERRTTLRGVVTDLVLRGVVADLDISVSILEGARDDEQEYHDNVPESMQQGEKGERTQEIIDELEEAISSLKSAVNTINGVIS